MSNATVAGLVQTVLGPVRPEVLGPTSTHEHLLIDITFLQRETSAAGETLKAAQPVAIESCGWVGYDAFRNRDNLELLDEGVAVSEALRFKMAGGRTIVDATPIGIGRDPRALARIARATGLNVVMGAGYYVDGAHPEGMDSKTDGDIAEEIVADVTTGVGDTGIKAGIVGELGCSWPLTGNERKVLVAAAAAQRQTGAALLVHPGRDQAAPSEILDVLSEAGADVGRVIMGHLDRTFSDASALLELAARGCYLEYDGFGWETSNYPLSSMDTPNDAQRIGFVRRLIDEGHASQIVIAQDVCTKHRTAEYGGHGFAHILDNVAPRMREAGIAQEDIDSILVRNPARVLAFAPPQAPDATTEIAGR